MHLDVIWLFHSVNWRISWQTNDFILFDALCFLNNLDIGPQYSLMMFDGRRWYNDVVMIWLGLKQAVHHLYTYLHTHAYIYICIHVYLHTTHTYIYIHTHIRIYIYIHIYVCIPAESNPWMPEVKRKRCFYEGLRFQLESGHQREELHLVQAGRRRELGWPCLDTFWLFNDRDYIIGFMLF